MIEQFRKFEIKHSQQIFNVIIILGAFNLIKMLPLEDWLFSYSTIELDFTYAVVADILFSLIFVFFLVRDFQLNIFDNLLSKKKLSVFLIGIVGVGLLITLQTFLEKKHLLLLIGRQALDNISAVYANYPIFAIISYGIIAPIINELIFRGLFFKFFLNDKSKRNHILVILFSGLLYPTLILMRLGEFTLFDIGIYALSGLLFSICYYYSDDLKIPILLHILFNMLIFV